MASPFVEDHTPKLAAALAGLATAGRSRRVDAVELAELSGVPLMYVRVIGRRYLDDVNELLAPGALEVFAKDGAWLLGERSPNGGSGVHTQTTSALTTRDPRRVSCDNLDPPASPP